MRGILQMVNLDIITMKPYFKSYALMFILAAFMSFMNVGVSFTSLIMTIYLLLMSGSIFSVQEKNNLDRLYSSLSVDGKTVVLGRYIFILLHGLFAIAASYLISTAVAIYQKTPVDMSEFLSGALVSLAFLCVLGSVQLPIYYRLGYTKARVAVMVPFLAIALGIPMLANFFPDFDVAVARVLVTIENNMALFAFIGFAAAVLLFVCSYHISLRMRRKSMQG